MAQKKSTSKSKYWAAQVAKWRDSGLPATRFCKRQHLHVASFYNWRKRLAGPEKAAQVEKPSFLPINVVPGPLGVAETDVEITFGGDRKVRVKGSLSPAHLAEVAQALVASC